MKNNKPVLQFAGPGDAFPAGSIVSTMWETTRLSEFMVQNLNRAKCVIVPSEVIRGWFCESGVKVPIRIVPLGIDPAIYHPTFPEPSDLFAVHASFRAHGGGHRKGFQNIVDAWTEALGDEPDCFLRFKVFPDCPILKPKHPRITIDRTAYEDEGMANWYRMASVGLCMTYSEGWGLTPHEQLACGRPMIAPMHSGMLAYLTEECCYPVAFTPEPARGIHYEGLGEWFKPDHDSAVAMLRMAYENQELRIKKGEAAALRAAEFTWERSGKALAEVIREFGLLPVKTVKKIKYEKPRIVIDPDFLKIMEKTKSCPYRGGRDPDSCGCSPLYLCNAGKGRAIQGKQFTKVTDQDCVTCFKTGSVQKVIAFTAYNRPHYLKQMIDSLRNCYKISDYLILPHVEPGNEETKELIRTIDFAECRPTWNHRKLGNKENVFRMWENAFYFSEYCIFLDEDVIFSPDALLYHEWAAEAFRNDPNVSSVTSYNRNREIPPDLSDAYSVAMRRWFHSMTFATWRDRYRMVISKIDDGPWGMWDGAMLHQFCEIRGMGEAYPILGRSDHIGLETSLQDVTRYTPEWFAREVSSGYWAGLESRVVEPFRHKVTQEVMP